MSNGLAQDCGCGPSCCERDQQVETQVADGSCCTPTGDESCGCQTSVEAKALDLEFLYLDLSQCDRCQSTDEVMAEAIDAVSTALDAANIQLSVQRIHVTSEAQAAALGFVTSPTLRLNGQDIQLDYTESVCSTCGDLCGAETQCRTWHYQGQTYDAPPKGLIVEALLKATFGAPQPEPIKLAQGVPDNLKRFFDQRTPSAVVV